MVNSLPVSELMSDLPLGVVCIFTSGTVGQIVRKGTYMAWVITRERVWRCGFSACMDVFFLLIMSDICSFYFD